MPVGIPFTSENQPEGRGRPKGSHSLKTILRRLLDTKLPTNRTRFSRASQGT